MQGNTLEGRRALHLFFTSDTHGSLFPTDYATGEYTPAGLLSIATQIANQRGENTLVLDAGDSLQGTPLIGYYLEHPDVLPFHPIAAAMNAMGVSYYTLGNHDFNFGYEVLSAYVHAMNGCCLAANVHDRTGRLPLQSEAIHVLPNGLRIGLTGVVTGFVNVWEKPEHLLHLEVTEPLAAARSARERLLAAGVDLTICLYHGGFEEDLQTGTILETSGENQACTLARELGFDLLLTGHQHMAVDGIQIGETWAVQPPALARQFLEIELRETEAGRGQFARSSSLVSVSGEVDPSLAAPFKPLEAAVQHKLACPMGKLLSPIPPSSKLEIGREGSPLANLINQVQLLATGAMLSATSLGNNPVAVPETVAYREVRAAYQFENTLKVFEIRGDQLCQYLERCAQYLTLDSSGEPEISNAFLQPKVEHYNYDLLGGLDYAFDIRRPIGSRVVRMNYLDGSPIQFDDKLTLVVNSYRATGTGGYSVLSSCPVVRESDADVADLLCTYITEHSPVAIPDNTRFALYYTPNDPVCEPIAEERVSLTQGGCL